MDKRNFITRKCGRPTIKRSAAVSAAGILFFLVLAGNGTAQIDPGQHKPAATTKPVGSGKTVVKRKKVYVERTAATQTVKFICNAPAELWIDGEKKAVLQADKPFRYQLPLGDYLLVFINGDNEADNIKKTISITETGTERIYETDLRSVIDKRLSKEREEENRIKQFNATKNGSLNFDEGTYTGEYVGTKTRNGTGTMLFKNEPVHGGRWRYEGEWKNDERNGKGTLTSVPYLTGQRVGSNDNIKTEIYKGLFRNGKLEGEGTYEIGTDIYTGNFIAGIRNGKGKLIATDSYNKSVYEGEWKNGKQEGKGILVINSDGKYEGEWKNGKQDGKGIYTTTSGTSIVGEWKNGLLNGQVVYSSGTYKYTGGYINDRKEGFGTFTDGKSSYTGEWKNGKQEGKGEYIWANGDKYNGMWKEDYKQGKGIMIYANGEKYDGEWNVNRQQGWGTYSWNNGNNYNGQWSWDKMNGTGTMTYANGERYEGGWSLGKQHGKGVLYDKNNKKIKDVESDMEQAVLNTDYLVSKTVALNEDKTYFVNYILTDTTFILYIPRQFSHRIYFDVNNNNQVDQDIDLLQNYFSPRDAFYRAFIESPQNNKPKLSISRRYNNNIFEFIFRLKDITNSKMVAFQVYFKEGENAEKHLINLPKRKEELDFRKGKMYYIPVK